ncbi:MAG TPA: hypothetical protein PLW65_24195 [Pseudomonadota bacterium]|nr:hypothetical protein [Pseudomonadota bacterium]
MNLFRPLVLFSILLAAGPAAAGKPGDAVVEEPDKESGDQRIEIFDSAKAETLCKVKGKVCLKPSTGTEAEGSETAPVFKRRNSSSKTDWVVDLYGNLKKPALAGNAQFVFSETPDPKVPKAREIVGTYQALVKAGTTVAARIRLSTEEGFRGGHTYHAQVVQIIDNKEVLLAESDFQLK